MPGVIDEFLIKVGMEGDPSGLVDAYKKIFSLMDEREEKEKQQQQESEQQDNQEQKREKRKAKVADTARKMANGTISLAKRGVSMARNWAVSLLAVDGAAMAVVGKLSQMAVEYDNTAGSINMAASEMKAWEDAMKSAGASTSDVKGSLEGIYQKSFQTQVMGQNDEGFTRAMAAFGVALADETGELRNAGDIFGDIIKGFREQVEGGMDKNMAIGLLEQAGVSRNLVQPILRTDETGQYRFSDEDLAMFKKAAAPLDELSEASMDFTETLTKLGATFREKFANVLIDLMDKGTLNDLADKLMKLVESIDVDKLVGIIDKLMEGLGKFVDWLGTTAIPKVADTVGDVVTNRAIEKENPELVENEMGRMLALQDAIKNQMSFREWGEFGGIFKGSATRMDSPGGMTITESELLAKANEMGLDVNNIFQKAGLPELNNTVYVMIDGRYIPFTKQEYSNYNGNDASALDSGVTQ